MSHEHELYKKALKGMMPDCEQTKIRARAISTGKLGGAVVKRRWWIPAVSVAAAVIIICSAVPGVRAAIANLFTWTGGDTADLLNVPSSERPLVENLAVQQVVPQQWRIRTFADTEIPWASEISDFRIEEAVLDAGELTLRYTVDSTVPELAEALEVSDDLIDGKIASPARCLLNPWLLVDAANSIAFEEIREEDQNWINLEDKTYLGQTVAAQSKNGKVTMTSVFNVGDRTLPEEMILYLFCGNALQDGPDGARYEYLGCLELPFQMVTETTAAKTAPARSYTVDGYTITITEAVLSPTGLKISFAAPKDTFEEQSWDFEIYADGNLVTGANENSSYLDYLMWDNGSSEAEGRIHVPFMDMAVSEITLVPMSAEGHRLGEDVITLHFA